MQIGDNSVEMQNTTSGSEANTAMKNSDDGYISTIIGVVIAAVILVVVSLLMVILHYMYRHKGTYHTNEAKGAESAESADAALRGDPALCNAMDEGKKEYFI